MQNKPCLSMRTRYSLDFFFGLGIHTYLERTSNLKIFVIPIPITIPFPIQIFVSQPAGLLCNAGVRSLCNTSDSRMSNAQNTRTYSFCSADAIVLNAGAGNCGGIVNQPHPGARDHAREMHTSVAPD